MPEEGHDRRWFLECGNSTLVEVQSPHFMRVAPPVSLALCALWKQASDLDKSDRLQMQTGLADARRYERSFKRCPHFRTGELLAARRNRNGLPTRHRRTALRVQDNVWRLSPCGPDEGAHLQAKLKIVEPHRSILSSHHNVGCCSHSRRSAPIVRIWLIQCGGSAFLVSHWVATRDSADVRNRPITKFQDLRCEQNTDSNSGVSGQYSRSYKHGTFQE